MKPIDNLPGWRAVYWRKGSKEGCELVRSDYVACNFYFVCNDIGPMPKHLQAQLFPSRAAIEMVLERHDLHNFKADVIRDLESIVGSFAI